MTISSNQSNDSTAGVVLPYMEPGKVVVGIDEVGRGAWAGPLLMGAVILSSPPPAGLTDSKLMSPARRVAMSRFLKASGAQVGLGWVSASEIDQIGLAKALRIGAERAVSELCVPYDLIVIDGTINFLPKLNSFILPKADALVPAVSAASVIAKVARDAYMRRLHIADPRYRFDRHVGYGTAQHLVALQLNGASLNHRHSFAPIRRLNHI